MMKKISKLFVGVIVAFALFSCAQGAPDKLVGKWNVIIDTYSSVTEGTMYYDIKADGTIDVYRNADTTDDVTKTPGEYKILTNSCNVIKVKTTSTGNDFEYTYENSGNTMTWKIKSDSPLGDAIVGAATGPTYKFKKRTN